MGFKAEYRLFNSFRISTIRYEYQKILATSETACEEFRNRTVGIPKYSVIHYHDILASKGRGHYTALVCIDDSPDRHVHPGHANKGPNDDGKDA